VASLDEIHYGTTAGLPDVAFSDWAPWEKRASISGSDQPGVYVLARFDDPPFGRADPLAREVIYVGETCDNTLRGRWRQFERSAFEGKRGHSGGRTYRATFADDGATLYVAAFPAGQVGDELRPLFIRYVERKLILDFALRWGKAPVCNLK